MLKQEYFELRKKLKEVIKGRIFVGVKEGIATVIIYGYKGIIYKLDIDAITNKSSIEAMADEIERRYHGFILSRFLFRRSEKGGGVVNNESI